MFAVGPKIDYDIRTYRYHRKDTTDKYAKAKIAAGAIAGAVIPPLLFAKKQNTSVFKIKYGLKEMFLTSSSAIAGGLLAGLAFDKKEHRTQKVHEGVFQFMNSSVPMFLTAGIYSLVNKMKLQEYKSLKIGGTLLGLLGGMHLAAKMANFINDPYDKVPDRKLTLKDSVANIDDAIGVLMLAKVPVAQKIQAEKILPAVYGLCGYRAGTSS